MIKQNNKNRKRFLKKSKKRCKNVIRNKTEKYFKVGKIFQNQVKS